MGALDKNSRTPQRILIVNPFGIGDVLFSTPLVRAVRQAFPDSRIGYLCNRRTERMVRQNPHIDEVFMYEKDEMVALWHAAPWRCVRYLAGLIGRLHRWRFDVVIDLSLGERYGFIVALLGVPRRMGFNYRRRARFLTESLTIDGYHDDHVVDYYRRFLSFLGVRLLDASVELQIDSEDARWASSWLEQHGVDGDTLLVGLVPAGGVSWGIDAPFRRWSFEGFAAVADALAQRYRAQVILFGEASDRSVCQTVARLMRHPVFDLSGQTTLGQFVSLLARLNLVICNDGGPLHLAVSQRVKTVSVFGPVDPQVYGPYPPSPQRHRVICRTELPCRPCYRHFRLPPCPYERACLTTIEPEEVIAACAQLLGRQPSSADQAVHA